MFIFLENKELFGGSNDQFMGLILVSYFTLNLNNTSSISFIFMLITQMLSLYHCTRYHFLNICKILNTLFYLSLIAENTMISLWVYFGKKMLHLTYYFRDLQYMYCYLWSIRTDQIMISNCPNAGTDFTHGL